MIYFLSQSIKDLHHDERFIIYIYSQRTFATHLEPSHSCKFAQKTTRDSICLPRNSSFCGCAAWQRLITTPGGSTSGYHIHIHIYIYPESPKKHRYHRHAYQRQEYPFVYLDVYMYFDFFHDIDACLRDSNVVGSIDADPTYTLLAAIAHLSDDSRVSDIDAVAA